MPLIFVMHFFDVDSHVRDYYGGGGLRGDVYGDPIPFEAGLSSYQLALHRHSERVSRMRRAFYLQLRELKRLRLPYGHPRRIKHRRFSARLRRLIRNPPVRPS